MKKTDLLIIGSGPGGYRTAIYAAKNGLDVTIVEKDNVGGTCLNVGCIPTKCLAHDAEARMATAALYSTSPPIDFPKVMERKASVVSQLREGVASLLSQPGIKLLKGCAVFLSDSVVDVDGEKIMARNIIIATGSRAKTPPFINEATLQQQAVGHKHIVTSDELLSVGQLPKRLTIIGAGVIGMEFASIFAAFGSEVTVIEFLKECLPPIDSDIAKRLRKTLEKRGVTFFLQSAVSQIVLPSVGKPEDNTTVIFSRKGKEEKIKTDLVLIATGRQPNTDEIGLAMTSINYDTKGIMVNNNMETSVKGIYAIGDVNGRQMLAHAATFQGFRAVNHILGKPDHIRLDIMPSAIFTYPEAACVGKTEELCKTLGLSYTVHKGFYRSNGKALSMDETAGMLKLLVADDGAILGGHVYGAHAADIIQELSALMNRDAKLDDIRDIIHIHPTLGEILQDAVI
ncbi:MAG: dihydrolipoyl dehydrogenase [Prevotella sp.]|nr:dihydrolipoyl dehydrogenase [Prevotella sp.]